MQLEGLDKLKKFNDLIGTRTRGLSACSIAPQPNKIIVYKSFNICCNVVF
jgi:hypothetical protein